MNRFKGAFGYLLLLVQKKVLSQYRHLILTSMGHADAGPTLVADQQSKRSS